MEALLTEWWPVKGAGKGMCSTGIQGKGTAALPTLRPSESRRQDCWNVHRWETSIRETVGPFRNTGRHRHSCEGGGWSHCK